MKLLNYKLDCAMACLYLSFTSGYWKCLLNHEIVDVRKNGVVDMICVQCAQSFTPFYYTRFRPTTRLLARPYTRVSINKLMSHLYHTLGHDQWLQELRAYKSEWIETR